MFLENNLFLSHRYLPNKEDKHLHELQIKSEKELFFCSFEKGDALAISFLSCAISDSIALFCDSK